MVQFTRYLSSATSWNWWKIAWDMMPQKWLETHVKQAERAADYTDRKVNSDLIAYESDLDSNRRAFQDIQTEAAAIMEVLQGNRVNRQKIAHSVKEIGKIIANQI